MRLINLNDAYGNTTLAKILIKFVSTVKKLKYNKTHY